MILKITGAFCILLSSSALGVLYGIEVKKHLEALLIQKQIMMMLKSEITYGRSELHEAFLSISMKVKEPYKEWLSELSGRLRKREEADVRKIWQETVADKLNETRLTKGELSELSDLGMQMGYMDQELQTGAIDLYLNRLDMHIQAAKEEQAGKVKLCNCLGVMGGIFIIVILL